ncbi:MAG: hypothetical protein GXO76_13785, partial [Calditrichaeota bacterium]|nr:hypothetical protein [Calditrichota bacterium]
MAAPQKQTVRLSGLKTDEFRLKTGDFVVEYGKQTDKKILIYNPSTKGVLDLRFLGGNSDTELLNSVTRISYINDSTKVTVIMKGSKPWASYVITLNAFKAYPGLLNWRLQFSALKNLPEIHPVRELRLFQRQKDQLIPVENGNFIIGLEPRHPTYRYAKQAPFVSPLIYLCSPGWLGGTLLYFEDLTSLNHYFELTHSGAEKIMVDICNSESSFGYKVPDTINALPVGKNAVITDSYLYLSSYFPRDEADVAVTFFKLLAPVYNFIGKPETNLTHWKRIADREIKDLARPELWVTVKDRPYLRSYISDKRESAELISQLDVLLPLTEYERVYGGVKPLVEKLTRTLPVFYSKRYQALNNNFPNGETGDSWYMIEEMTQLAKLSELGNKTARNILLRSVKGIVTLAHNVDYEFPNHFSYASLEATFGREPDVAGGYAYLMLELYHLTGKNQFLDEAKASIQHIRGRYFGLNYELQMTAMSAVAAARLFKLTGEKKYLEMSYMPLANILLVSWLWECNYGYAKSYSTFFGLSPMMHSGVITMKEQYEVWNYLREYVNLVQNKIPKSINQFIAEFYRYTLYTLKYALPPFLPKDAMTSHPTAYQSVTRNDLSLYIPLEDLREGRSKSGLIGQQIYGAGGPITFAVEA